MPDYDHVVAERWVDIARAFKVTTPVGLTYKLRQWITQGTGHRLHVTRLKASPYGVLLLMCRAGVHECLYRTLAYPFHTAELASAAYDLYELAEDERILKGDTTARPPEGILDA